MRPACVDGLRRTQFQITRGKQKGHEHGDRIEIDLAASYPGCVSAGNECRGYPQRNRHIHADPALEHASEGAAPDRPGAIQHRSEEHTSELQSLMRISYAVFCLKKKKNNYYRNTTRHIITKAPLLIAEL